MSELPYIRTYVLLPLVLLYTLFTMTLCYRVLLGYASLTLFTVVESLPVIVYTPYHIGRSTRLHLLQF